MGLMGTRYIRWARRREGRRRDWSGVVSKSKNGRRRCRETRPNPTLNGRTTREAAPNGDIPGLMQAIGGLRGLFAKRRCALAKRVVELERNRCRASRKGSDQILTALGLASKIIRKIQW